MPYKPKVLILEATGQVGKAVLPHLIAADKVEVIAAARDPKKAASLGIPVVRLDLDHPKPSRRAYKASTEHFWSRATPLTLCDRAKTF